MCGLATLCISQGLWFDLLIIGNDHVLGKRGGAALVMNTFTGSYSVGVLQGNFPNKILYQRNHVKSAHKKAVSKVSREQFPGQQDKRR